MLSDEEEAIEWLKRLVKINKRDNLDDTFAEILLNLIEKQSKEIEENKKYLVNLTHEQYIKLVEQIRSEISKEWVDKIKAKIEYYEKIDNPVGKRVLQLLLEKE